MQFDETPILLDGEITTAAAFAEANGDDAECLAALVAVMNGESVTIDLGAGGVFHLAPATTAIIDA